MCAGNSTRHTYGCSCESVKVFETENVSTWEGLEPPTFGLMPNALTTWAIRARHLLSHVFEQWLWWYKYLFSAGNSIQFRHTDGVLVKVSKFLRQMSRQCGGLKPPSLFQWIRLTNKSTLFQVMAWWQKCNISSPDPNLTQSVIIRTHACDTGEMS